MGVINIYATNFKENVSGSIREDGGQIVNQSEAKVVQNGAKGVDYDKNKERKPPTDIRITKVEGPFDDKGKLIKKINLGTSYIYKATTSRKPKKEEIALLKWSIKFDQGDRLIINGVASLNNLDGDKIIIHLKINQEFEKGKVYAFYQKADESVSVELSLKKVKLPILILQGSRRKGKNRENNGTALDMLYKDYSIDAVGYEKLRKQLFDETYNVEKQNSFYNVNSRTDNAKKQSDLKIEKIKSFLDKSTDDLFKIFRNDIKGYSSGEIETVAIEMVDKMEQNTGGEYTNKKLTSAVIGHENSKTFISATKKVIKEYLKENKGNIEKLEIIDDSKGLLYEKLVRDKVDNPKFGDWFSGLGITINDVWAYQIYITDFKVNKNTFQMKLEYIYWDHFGLDYPDIQKFDKDIFYSWFVLQHYKGFKPFITKLDIAEELKGTF